MMEKKRTYIAIDLKSFYASVECKERNRDPLTTNPKIMLRRMLKSLTGEFDKARKMINNKSK